MDAIQDSVGPFMLWEIPPQPFCVVTFCPEDKGLGNTLSMDPRTQAWWCLPIILALGRQSQEDCHDFEVSLLY